MFKIFSVIGLGVVGGAIYETLSEKGLRVYGYDKFKNGGIGSLDNCLDSDVIFLALPTPYKEELKDYDFRTPKFWQTIPETQMFDIKDLRQTAERLKNWGRWGAR